MSSHAHTLRAETEPAIDPTKFLGLECENSRLDKAKYVVLPVPYERTTSFKKGTENGPKMLLEVSSQLELWDEELKEEIWQEGIHTLPPFATGEDADAFFPKLESRVDEIARFKNKTLFVVGGEHSLTQACFAPYSRLYPNLSVLHFDAHADLRSEYEGSEHNHACALYPASRTCPVVQIGIRSVGVEELPNIDNGRVKTYLMHENRNMKALIAKVLKGLTKDVYISIDLDGFDPSVIPGTGTPQPGGFQWYDALDLFKAVFLKKNVVGVDMMELCPLTDDNISEFNAAKLLYRLMGYQSLKRRKK